MRAFTALVVREISERRALLAAAAVASLLPILAPLLPATGSNPASDIREAVMWIMVGCLVPLFALLLGVSFIGRDLAEGRLGFYFAQPLSGPTIWFGKLTAVVLLIWAAQLIMMLPAALLSGQLARIVAARGLFFEFLGPWFSSLTVWVAPVAILLLSHALGIIWRARSAWLVIDLIAILIVAAGAWLAMSPFQHLMLFVDITGWLFLTGSVLVGLTIAGAVQITSGRVDLKRGHRAMTSTLWTVLITAGVGLFAFGLLGTHVKRRAHRYTHLRQIQPLRTCESRQAEVGEISVGSGSWIAVSGPSPGRLDYRPRFLMNIDDGRWLAIDPGVRWYSRRVEFSDDGRVAVWVKRLGRDEWAVMYANLDARHPVPRYSGITMSNRGRRRFQVNADGSRLALIDGGTIAIYELDSGTQLVATVIESDFVPVFTRFEGDDGVRIFADRADSSRGSGLPWKSYHLDIASRTLSEGQVTSSPWEDSIEVAGDEGVRLVARDKRGDEEWLVIIDMASGEIIAELGEWPGRRDINVRSDGRILVVRDWDDHHLEVFDPDGHLLRRIDLGDGNWISLVSDFEPGRIVVALRFDVSSTQGTFEYRTAIVNIDNGDVEPVLEGYIPILVGWNTNASPGAWQAGSIASRLVMGEDHSLHLWDTESNQVKPVIPVPE